MSCVLFLWREEADARIEPATLIEVLEDGENYRGLVCLPLDEVRNAFRLEFPDLRDDEHTLAWASEGERFEVCFLMRDERAVSLATVYCSKSSPVLQRVRHVAASLGCRAYDPQRAGLAIPSAPM